MTGGRLARRPEPAIAFLATLLLLVVARPAAGQGPPSAPADTGSVASLPPVLPLPAAAPRPAWRFISTAELAPSPEPVPAPDAAPPAEPGPLRSAWKRTVEIAGSLFMGNKPQTVLTTHGRTSHADSTFELGADVRFVYGETSQDGRREVSQRLWTGSVNLDLWPFAAQSPFLLGTIESSLERRIELRLSAGIGHKLTFVDNERGLASFSLALLSERSRFPTSESGVEEETLTRFSARLRLRRQIGARTSLNHESYYRPEFANLTQFTFTNSSSASYRLNEMVNLKLTYLDNYDSESRLRGARSNYDGQLVVGVAAEF